MVSSLKDKCVDWALDVAKIGDRWWVPVVLLAVCSANSLTGGMFIWCFGVLQSMLYIVIVMCHGKFGIVLGPTILTIGSAIAAVTYIHLMKTGGADTLLEKTGAKGSKWLDTTTEWAANYGAAGLIFLQVVPIPIPTAVIVVAGMLGSMDEYTVFAVVIGSKFVQLVLGAVALKVATEGQTVEDYLRQQFKGEEGDGGVGGGGGNKESEKKD